MSKIFLLRHGETVDNAEHVFSGLRNVALTEKGMEQAKSVREILKDESIDIAFSSPMIRTIDTLKIVLKPHQNVKICLDQRIIERSYGTLQGRNKDEFAKISLALFKFFHRSYYAAPPGGESLYSVDIRVRNFISDLIETLQHEQKNVIICAHGNSMRAIRIFFERRPQEEFNKIETMVGELFVYESDSFLKTKRKYI